MTDTIPRAMEKHAERRGDALLLHQELLTDSPVDAVTRLASALADERMKGMEDLITHLSDSAAALPVQHEQENLGQCTYNWYRYIGRKLRVFADAKAGPKEASE